MKFLLFFLLSPILSFSQTNSEKKKDEKVKPVTEELIFVVAEEDSVPSPTDTTKRVVYDFVENEPTFPGGEQAMIKFIVDNVVYPESALDKSEQGIVFVKFVVEKDGEITGVGIRKGVCESLNAEAMRVVKLMPNWKPGEQIGKAVAVNYNLPIHFRLSNNEDAPQSKVELTGNEKRKAEKAKRKREKREKKAVKKRK